VSFYHNIMLCSSRWYLILFVSYCLPSVIAPAFSTLAISAPLRSVCQNDKHYKALIEKMDVHAQRLYVLRLFWGLKSRRLYYKPVHNYCSRFVQLFLIINIVYGF